MSEGPDHCTARPYEKSEFRELAKLRYHVFVCGDGKGLCGCEASGSGELLAALRREVVMRRLTAEVKVTLMQCRQPGARGPVLVLHPDGLWYEGLGPEQAAEFVDCQIVRGEPLARWLMRRSPLPVTAVPAHVAGAAGRGT